MITAKDLEIFTDWSQSGQEKIKAGINEKGINAYLIVKKHVPSCTITPAAAIRGSFAQETAGELRYRLCDITEDRDVLAWIVHNLTDKTSVLNHTRKLVILDNLADQPDCEQLLSAQYHNIQAAHAA